VLHRPACGRSNGHRALRTARTCSCRRAACRCRSTPQAHRVAGVVEREAGAPQAVRRLPSDARTPITTFTPPATSVPLNPKRRRPGAAIRQR
jgi:hypothetical protein